MLERSPPPSKEYHVNILGIVTKTHDSGIALLRDGIPALVLEEERFNRQKHTLLFPSLSLKSAFDAQGQCFDDVDVVTTPWHMKRLRWSFFSAVKGALPQSLNLLRPSAHRGQGTAIVNLPMRLWCGLGRRFGLSKVPRIVQVAHHDAHAATFFVSPFEEAAVIIRASEKLTDTVAVINAVEPSKEKSAVGEAEAALTDCPSLQCTPPAHAARNVAQ